MAAQCANCGFIFKSSEEVGQPCPRCGSLDVKLKTGDRGKGHEGAKEKRYDPTKKHRHGSYYTLEKGERIGKDGKLVLIERVIDRDSDHYTEVVKDKDGNVIANKDERLSEHK